MAKLEQVYAILCTTMLIYQTYLNVICQIHVGLLFW